VLPDAPELLDRERRSRREGSGLGRRDLVGSWRLERIWSKGSLRPATISAALLRGLAARLQLAVDEAEGEQEGMLLVNSVRLGPLELRFEGSGRLQGRRPLLVFGFDRVKLLLGGQVLIERSLPPANPRKPPFFALIAAERPSPSVSKELASQEISSPTEPVGWLAARGRSGGLALWLADACGVGLE
jgi:hypothetical protein